VSFDALAWAAKAKGIRPAEKLVLLGLAECASRDGGLAFPSIAALIEFSGLNRKTVIGALSALVERRLIAETGDTVGKTAQIKVYRLIMEAVPKAELLDSAENGTLSAKQSQKRDTEQVREPVTSEDKSSSENGEDDFAARHVFEFWNEKAPAWGKRKIRDVTPERKKLVDARIAQHGLEGWQEVLANLDRSDFFQRANGLNFDWLIQKKNFLKVLEGNYNG
jgi:pyocin large subunit-like protein